MITRCKIGKGITGAVRYIFGEGRDPDFGELHFLADGEATRVDWFGGLNFGFEVETREDADLARRIMEFDAQNQIEQHPPVRDGLRSPGPVLATRRGAHAGANGCRRAGFPDRNRHG